MMNTVNIAEVKLGRRLPQVESALHTLRNFTHALNDDGLIVDTLLTVERVIGGVYAYGSDMYHGTSLAEDEFMFAAHEVTYLSEDAIDALTLFFAKGYERVDNAYGVLDVLAVGSGDEELAGYYCDYLPQFLSQKTGMSIGLPTSRYTEVRLRSNFEDVEDSSFVLGFEIEKIALEGLRRESGDQIEDTISDPVMHALVEAMDRRHAAELVLHRATYDD